MLGRYGEISAADTVDGNGYKDTLTAQLCAQNMHAYVKQHERTQGLHTYTAELNLSYPSLLKLLKIIL